MRVDNDLACDELTELISAYVDGELSKEDSAAVAQHIEKCPGCAQVIECTEALSRRIRVAARRGADRRPGPGSGLRPGAAGLRSRRLDNH